MNENGRVIIGAVAALAAAIIPITFTTLGKTGSILTWATLAVALAGGVLLMFWPTRKTTKEKKDMRDSYVNNGNNSGHIGPVNIGKQAFQLTQYHIDDILRQCPRNLAVKVVAVGSQNAFPMRDAIATALEKSGYTVVRDSVTQILPALDSPLTLSLNGSGTTIFISPDS